MVPTRRLRRRMNGNATDFQHVKNPRRPTSVFRSPSRHQLPPPPPHPVACRRPFGVRFCGGRCPWTFFAAISVLRARRAERPYHGRPVCNAIPVPVTNSMIGQTECSVVRRRGRRPVRAARDAVCGPFLEGSQTRAREPSCAPRATAATDRVGNRTAPDGCGPAAETRRIDSPKIRFRPSRKNCVF